MDGGGDGERRRPIWEVALGILGAAAGLSVFVIVLGAFVMWVRLDSVGLPPERGLAISSKQTLAVLGMHKLVMPLVLSAAVVGVVFALLGIGVTKAGTLQLRRAAANKRRLRLICGAALLATCVFAISTPLTPTFAMATAGLAIPVVAAYVAAVKRLDIRLSHLRRATAFYVVVVVIAVALTTEAEPPSILEYATVTLKTGGTDHGYFVGEDGGAIYLGIPGGSVLTIPHDTVVNASVESPVHTSWYGEHPSLLEKAVGPIFK
jgi:hypothetical protein